MVKLAMTSRKMSAPPLPFLDVSCHRDLMSKVYDVKLRKVISISGALQSAMRLLP